MIFLLVRFNVVDIVVIGVSTTSPLLDGNLDTQAPSSAAVIKLLQSVSQDLAGVGPPDVFFVVFF